MSETATETGIAGVVTVTLNTALDRVIEAPGLAIGAHLPGRVVLRQPAGKGLNVSRALGVLGVPSIATGFVGHADLVAFEASAQSASINAQFLAVEGETRENITLLDPTAETETHVRTSGFTVTPRDLERLTRKLSLLAKPGVVVAFSGSLPPGIEPDAFAAVVDTTLAAGALIAVDAEGAVLRSVLDKNLWLIKPNRRELETAVTEANADDDATLHATARHLASRIETVIVTSGAEGSCLFNRAGAHCARVDWGSDKVVSTVGCGDALLAGFLAGRLHGDDAASALALATAVASASVASPAPGTFSRDDVERFRTRTQITKL